jgi:hypothetical protein
VLEFQNSLGRVRNRVGSWLSYRPARLHRLAGWYDNSVPTRPFPTRFRAPIDCPKIPALENNALSSLQKLSVYVCVVLGCSTPPPPQYSWFRYNLRKDDSASFSRFLHGRSKLPGIALHLLKGARQFKPGPINTSEQNQGRKLDRNSKT